MCIVICCKGLFKTDINSGEKAKAKENSANYRVDLWKSTWNLFVDRPFGIGPGRFTYGVMDYKMQVGQWGDEKVVDFFPHNEYLRYLSEDGIIFSFFLCIFFLLVFRKMIQIKNTELKALLCALFIFFSIESFFQFPFANSLPFVFFAAMIAVIFRQTGKSSREIILPKWILFAAALLICFFCSRFLISDHWAFAHRSNEVKIVKACEYNSSNWRACLFAGNLLIEKGKYSEGESYLRELLKYQPYHFPALKHMSKSAFRQGRWQSGCGYLTRYDEVLGGRSSLHHWLIEKCQK